MRPSWLLNFAWWATGWLPQPVRRWVLYGYIAPDLREKGEERG